MRRRLDGIAAGLLGVVAIVGGLAAGFDPSESRSPAFFIGIARPPLDEQSLRLVRASGANSFRRTLGWSEVARADGTLKVPPDFSAAITRGRRLGLAPVVVLSYGNRAFDAGGYPQSDGALAAFGEFARFAGRSLGGRVAAWELWNEWNLGTGMAAGPGSPQAYARFVERVAPAAANAFGAPVWGGSMAGIGRANRWTEQAGRAGMVRALDGLTFHPYNYFLPPAERMPERGLAGFGRELEATIGAFPGGDKIPLYVTELGWPTHAGPDGVSLADQAKYTSRALLLLRANPRVRGVWFYTLFDRPGDSLNRENHFGLRFSDGTPKPAWAAFRATAELLNGVRRCEPFSFSEVSASVVGVILERAGGRRSAVFWTRDSGESCKIELGWPRSRGLFSPVVTAATIGSPDARPVPLQSRNDVEISKVVVTDMPLVIDPFPENGTVKLLKMSERVP